MHAQAAPRFVIPASAGIQGTGMPGGAGSLFPSPYPL